MMQQRGHRKKYSTSRMQLGFYKKEKFTAFVVIIMKYFCISQCDDYFHANSMFPTTTVFSKIEKTVTSLIVAVRTHTHVTRKQHTCDIQWSIKEDENHQTLSFLLQKSLENWRMKLRMKRTEKAYVHHQCFNESGSLTFLLYPEYFITNEL